MVEPTIRPDPLVLNPGDVILFQGDSITDAWRDHGDRAPNSRHALGRGYVFLAASRILASHPAHGLQIYNRGISGDRVPELAARWDRDCLALKPDVLSILVGVNDAWHGLQGHFEGSPESYRSDLEALVTRTRDALPDTKLILCEPFVLRCGAVTADWFPEFDHRRTAAREIASRAGAHWVAFHERFESAVTDSAPPDYWADDGAHPTIAGHQLMAEEWLRTVFGPGLPAIG